MNREYSISAASGERDPDTVEYNLGTDGSLKVTLRRHVGEVIESGGAASRKAYIVYDAELPGFREARPASAAASNSSGSASPTPSATRLSQSRVSTGEHGVEVRSVDEWKNL